MTNRLILIEPEKGIIKSIEVEDEPSFDFIKSFLGAPKEFYIEMHRCKYEGKSAWMLFDEDGLFNGWKRNEEASRIAGYEIVGPVAVYTGEFS